MTQEEKELLIKDLYARLPYSGVQIHVSYEDGFKYDKTLTYEDVKNYSQLPACSTTIVKPYLRSISSMSKEERDEYRKMLCKIGFTEFYKTADKILDFLYKNHFDVHGLIPKGLALETPEGMYELELLHYLLPLQNESDSEIDNSTKITVGCKIRSKTNPDEILRIVSDDCHGDKFECSNGSVLSLRQINKYYDIYIEENKGTIVIN